MRIAELWIYPIKGARGVRLPRTDVLFGGLRGDRRFMAVTSDGTFLTQRAHPRLALVDVTLDDDGMTISAPGIDASARVTIPREPDARGTELGPRRRVRVWDDEVDAIEVPGDAGLLLSEHLGTPCSLVFMPSDVVRQVELTYAKPGDRVGFADAYPILIASLASLADLNARLEQHVPMNRFRPNIVIDGGAAFDEERFERARIGDVREGLTLRMPKRCSRCQVTTVDQSTAAVGKEPLRTLASYRRDGKNVYFAQNAIPDAEGTIAEGDAVTYLDPR